VILERLFSEKGDGHTTDAVPSHKFICPNQLKSKLIKSTYNFLLDV